VTFKPTTSSVKREDWNPDVAVVAQRNEADDSVVDILGTKVGRGKNKGRVAL